MSANGQKLQIVSLIVNIAVTVILALALFILRDVRDRVARLETMHMGIGHTPPAQVTH